MNTSYMTHSSWSSWAFFIQIALMLFSGALLAAGIYTNYKAQKDFADLATSAAAETITPTAPDVNDQIVQTRQQLQRASFEIASLKQQISQHALNADQMIPLRESVSQVQALMSQIGSNSEMVLAKNADIQDMLVELQSLQERKIQEIYEARQEKSKLTFGLPFWAGILGLLATISSMVLAWRRDAREWRKDRRELIELRRRLTTTAPTK